MTEKKQRFYLLSDKEDAIIFENGFGLSQQKACDLLNALHEENTDLKQILKQQMKDPTNEINKLNDVINRLHWENHQLTTQIETIKNTIEEAYQNERTQIGKNTLKQLLERIQ